MKPMKDSIRYPIVFGKFNLEHRVEIIENPKDSAKTLLAIYQKGRIHTDEQFEWKQDVFVPRERNGVLNLIRLPKGIAPYESATSLLVDIGALLTTCVELHPNMVLLAAAWVLSSWRSEMFPAPPRLLLVGMPHSAKTTMLRFFQMLCRHGIFVNDLTPAAFDELHGATIPTLLFDETSNSAYQKTLTDLLWGGSTSVPKSEALLKVLYRCPKAFAFRELPKDRRFLSRCIVIPMHEPGRTNLRPVTAPQIELAAENLGMKLLQLRLERFGEFLCSKTLGPYSLNRDMYESLARTVTEDYALCDELLSLFLRQEQRMGVAP